MKKNLVKKLLIGGLITSLCLCCCFLNFNKNIKASGVNDFQEQNRWFEDSTFVPNNFTNINDLKGKTFTLSIFSIYGIMHSEFDIFIDILERDYVGIEINEETHETIQCIDYLQYPYIIFESFDYTTGGNNVNVFSFYQESSSNYAILYNNDVALNINSNFQMNGSTLSTYNNLFYLPIDNINEKDDVPLGYYELNNISGKVSLSNYSNFDFLTEINFLSNLDSYYFPIYQFLNFYIVFPNTDRYTLGFNSSEGLTMLDLFSYIQPYNANIEEKINYGKQQYTSGYNKGLSDATDGEYRFYFLTGIFNAVSDILAIEIFPNIQIGYFILVPLALGITGMIFYFWRKD